MTQNYQNIDLKTINQITKTLENIIAHSYGPRGSKTLLSTETGQVLISSDGVTVLRLLHFSHPVARTIIDSMTRVVNYTGDGSKTFILYITGYFEDLLKHNYNCKEGSEVLRYVHSIQKIKSHVGNNLLTYIRTKVPCSVCTITQDICYNILRTSLSNSFPPTVCDHLSNVLVEAIKTEEQTGSVDSALQNIADNFEDICIKVPNKPYTESKTINPFFIQRKLLSSTPCFSSVKFILCTFPIAGHSKTFDMNEQISLKSETSFISFMDHHQFLLRSFVDKCKDENITLVLCSNEISEQGQQLFQQSDISLVSYVPEEDCDWLISNLRIKPYTDILETIDSSMIYSARSCRPYVINGRECVHLDIGQTSLPKMILVCAPTDGLCNQTFIKLQKSIQSIACSSRSEKFDVKDGNIQDHKYVDSEIMTLVGGGGTFEFIVSQFLSELENACNDRDLSTSCKVLKESLLKIPQILFKNNSPSNTLDFRQYLLACKRIIDLRHKDQYYGYNRNGQVTDLLADGIVECCYIKVHVLMSALELIQQLLQIDCMVGVRTLKDQDQD